MGSLSRKLNEVRRAQLAEQDSLADKVKMRSFAATIRVLQERIPGIIVLVHARKCKLLVPAFQFDDKGHPIALVQEIHAALHFASDPDTRLNAALLGTKIFVGRGHCPH